jgi:hypothetical protein
MIFSFQTNGFWVFHPATLIFFTVPHKRRPIEPPPDRSSANTPPHSHSDHSTHQTDTGATDKPNSPAHPNAPPPSWPPHADIAERKHAPDLLFVLNRTACHLPPTPESIQTLPSKRSPPMTPLSSDISCWKINANQ